MVDREKVIAELKLCASGSCNGCMYFMNWDNRDGRCSDALKMDAVKLLEGQEQTPSGWVSVKDRLPKEDTIVLVARKYVEPGQKERLYVETAERIGFDWVSQTDEYKLHRQFHTQPYAWMPLPEPPKEDEDA